MLLDTCCTYNLIKKGMQNNQRGLDVEVLLLNHMQYCGFLYYLSII